MTGRPLIWLWLIAILLCPSALFAQTLTHLPGADDLLLRATDYGARRQYDAAISLLTAALERYPTYSPLYLALADWQEMRGLTKIAGSESTLAQISAISRERLLRDPESSRALFETYGQALRCLPETRAIRQRISLLLRNDFPLQLGPNGPLALPGDPITFRYALIDPFLPASERGVQQGLLTSTPLPVGEAFQRDPKFGQGERRGDPSWSFSHVLYAYSYDQLARGWVLRFRVIWQQAPGNEEARLALARQTARLLLRLAGTVSAYGGLAPRATDHGIVNVWLTEQHEAGAETMNENLYLYAVGVPRSAAEWIREITHEYGHQTLPPLAGFTQPEAVANGRLGERLFMHWLILNSGVGEIEPWLQALDGKAFHARFYYPLITHFAAIGENAVELLGTDAKAMDACIGMALYLESTRGSHYLTTALTDMRTPAFSGPNGFRQSVEDLEMYLQSFDNPVVTLRARDDLPGMTYRVYLRDGNWLGEVQGRDLPRTQFDVLVDNVARIPDGYARFEVKKMARGWHTIAITPVEGFPTPTISAIKLVWQGVADDAADVRPLLEPVKTGTPATGQDGK